MPPHILVRWLIGVSVGLSASAARPADHAAMEAARASILAADLTKHVNVLADDSFEGREAGSRGGRAAGGYIVTQLQRHGLKPAGDGGSYYQSFGAGYRNILALLPGSDEAVRNQYILIGAHYDHVGYGTPTNSYGPLGYIHNGADDNASGVAGLLEVIEAFGQLPSAPRRSVLFAFWDGEEKGLLGSKHWAAQPTVPLSQVQTTINLDMIGRLRKGRLLVYGTRTSYGLRRLVSEQNTSPDLWLDINWEMKADSDHHTFYERNIPTLMLHTDLHDDYHRPHDDAHKVNAAGMEQLNRLLFNVAAELADGSRQFPFRAAVRRESLDVRRTLEQPVAPRPPRLGVRWKDETASSGGVVVSEVFRNSAAEAAGLKVADRLVEFGGAPVESDAQLRRAVATSASTVTAKVERSGEEQPLEIKIQLAGSPVRLGVTWREDRAEPGTVIVTSVAAGSPAGQAGVRPGDRIYQINSQDFSDGESFRVLATTLPGPLELVLERQGRLRTVNADVPEASK
jgi:C-terminal processing protease CtpA/Prc